MAYIQRRSTFELKDDERYILNFANWNQWPVCPVKRYPMEGGIECAYLFIDQTTADALAQGKVRIYTGNMFAPLPTDPVKEYASFEEFFTDGWMVD